MKMSKGLYIRKISKLDNCEWKHKPDMKKYPCNNKAKVLVQSPKKGVIWKLCLQHSTMFGELDRQCTNCGCYSKEIN